MDVMTMIKKIRIDFTNPWVIAVCVVLAFVCVNGIAAVCEPQPQGLDAIRRTITYDYTVMWQPKARVSFDSDGIQIKLNGAGLRDGAFKRHRTDDYRVLSLGSTDTFGWGVTSQCTYTELLERQLQSVLGETRRAEVINAGIPGYTTWQGKQVFERYLDRYLPDLITIAYGMSDVESFRYYDNDGSEDGASRVLSWQPSFMSQFALGRFMQRLFTFHTSSIERELGPLYLQYSPARRVPVQAFEAHLHYMCAIAAARKIPVVLVKMPWNLPGYVPVWPGKLEVAHLHVVQAQLLLQLQRYDEALNKLSEAVISDPFSREAAFYAAVCYERLGNEQMTTASLAQLKVLDAYESGRLRPVYADVMESAARTDHVSFADAMASFARKGTVEELFLSADGSIPLPNAKGHAVIASTIFDTLLKTDMLSAEKMKAK